MENLAFLKKIWSNDKILFIGLCFLLIPMIVLIFFTLIQAFATIYLERILFDYDFITKWIFIPCMSLVSIGFLIFILKMGPRQRIKDPRRIQRQNSAPQSPLVADIPPDVEDTPVVEVLPPSLTPIQENVAFVKQAFSDLKMTPIIISEDTLYSSIYEKIFQIGNQEKWRTYLPISVSLLATLIVVNFDNSWNKFGFTGSQWLSVFILVFAAILFYMIALFIHSYMKKVTIENIITDIKRRSL
jgi:hypothetical protein